MANEKKKFDNVKDDDEDDIMHILQGKSSYVGPVSSKKGEPREREKSSTTTKDDDDDR